MKVRATVYALLCLGALVFFAFAGCGGSSAPPNKLVFTTEPSSGTAGTAFTTPTAVVVMVEDSSGNVQTSSTASITLAPSSGKCDPASTTTMTASNGVATFSNLMLDTAGTYTLTATSSGITNGTSASFTISPAAATKLVFTTEPASSGTAGTAFGAVVTIEDMYGNTEAGSSASVALTLASGPGSFDPASTTTVAASNGMATFSNLELDTAGAYTLKASSGTLTTATSTSITIGAATASQLVFTTEPPSTGTAGAAFGAAVTIEDKYGNTVNSSASVTISSTPAGVSGTATVNASNGVATFTNLILDTPTTYTLTATSGTLTSTVPSSGITISVGAASKLVFTTEPPSTGMAGTVFGAVVKVEDSVGNVVTGYSTSVSLTLASGPGSFALSSTLSATPISGVATFTNLVLDTAGSYTLKASSGSLTTATSTSISIGAATASKLVFTTQPQSTTAGAVITVAVTVEDQYNNIVTNWANNIALTPSSGSFVTGSLTSEAPTNGVATFSNLALDTANTYTLTAASGTLPNATSNSFTISVGSASKLVFTTEPPSSGTAGTAFGAVVQVEDSVGNLITTSTASVTITSTASGVTGTTTVAASGGIATFTNLLLDKTGTYTLTAASSGLTSVTSTNVVIGAGTATQLVFTTEPPSAGTAGTAFGATVQVEDANGNLVTSSTASVTITSTASGVAGTTTLAASGGIATFTNLLLDKTGTYTLTAASSGLASATSTNIVIGAGTATQLAFTGEPPSTGTDGTAFGAVVQVEDANGNLVTNSTASVSITSTASGVTGTTTVSASGGIATFTNLILNTPGAYTLTAASSGLTSATSTSITINVGPASKLVFTSEPPSTGTAGTAFGAVVQIEDAGGNLITASTASVTITSTASGVTGTLTVSASGGIATFTNLLLNKTGTYTLTAASSGLTSATSTNVVISAGTATQLVFTTEPPSAGAAGTAFGAVVQVEDANGNLVTTSTASVAITSTASGVTGTTTVAASGGIATFSNLLLDTLGTYTLTAASSGLTSATSTSITISSDAPSKLVFTIEPPSSDTAGTAFGAVVQIEDTNGNLVTSSTASVTITSTASGVTGTTTVAASGGIATFTNLLLNTTGTYTLTAASSGLTSATSTSIVISAGAPSKLVFTTEPPSNGTAGTAFGAVVKVEDAGGNLITTSTASVTITSTASGVTGTTTVVASGGIATFTNLLLDKTGTYTLTAASGSLTSATSTNIVIGAGAATQLVFTTEPPSSGTAGTAFGAVVQVEDANGNLVTSSTASVTITSTASGVTGTTTVAASGGIATFTNLTLNTTGTYTLTAASNGLTSATSTSIVIGVGTASKLVFSTEPPTSGTAGTAFGAVVKVEDAGGNLITTSTASVTITSTASGVTGTTTVAASGGIATFTNLILNTSGTYTLTAASSGLTSATSSSIVISAGAATQLAFSTEPPSSGTDGTAFGAVVEVEDAKGNLVTTSTASVTITSTASGVTGTTTVTASGGVATFTNLILNNTGTYTLTASSGSLTTATSSTIDISAPTGVNNANLKGTYVCKINGYNDSDGTSWARLSSIIADGSGGLTSGKWDQNGQGETTSSSGTVTGTYSIGADNNGVMTMNAVETSPGTGSNTPTTWAVALTNVEPAQEFRMVETDDVVETDDAGSTPSGQHSTGDCYLATTSAFALSTFNGGLVFSFNGTNGTMEMFLGRISVSNGNISGGVMDDASAAYSSVMKEPITGGSFTTPDSTYGRSTNTVTFSGGGSGTTVVYIIDANRMFILMTGAVDKAMSGDMRKQKQTSYSAANLNGAIVFYATGYEYTSGSVAGYYSNVYQVTGSSSGLTVNQSYEDDDGAYTAGHQNGGPSAVTFDSSNPGRATFSPTGSNETFYLYMYDNNSALEMTVTSSGDPVGAGWIEPQTQNTFTDAAVANTYMVGQLPLVEPASNGTVGEFILSSSGSITGDLTTAGEGDFTYDQPVVSGTYGNGAYSWDPAATNTGSFFIGTKTQGGSCVVISPTRAACIINWDPEPSVLILQK